MSCRVKRQKEKNQMKLEKINIEDGLYDSKLLQYLWYKKPDNDLDEQIIQVLRKLINKNLRQLYPFTRRYKMKFWYKP